LRIPVLLQAEDDLLEARRIGSIGHERAIPDVRLARCALAKRRILPGSAAVAHESGDQE
jgi:hypothetical protein